MADLVAEYARHEPLRPTYKRLREAGNKHFAETTSSEQALRNILSALSTWMTRFNFRDSDIVGTEFDVEFEKYARDFRDTLAAEGKKERTVQDRIGQIGRWKALVVQIASAAELPEKFSEALTEAMLRRDMSIAELSRHSGLGVTTLNAWARGETRPTQHVAIKVKALEQALRLPADSLASKLGFVIKRKNVTAAAKEAKLQMASYSERLSHQRKPEFRLTYLKAIPQGVQEEWTELLNYKTSHLREHASSNDVWRVKSRDEVGNKPSWCAVMANGDIVPAADAAWSFIGRYLSWLALDVAHGGAGLAAERINTLAFVLNKDLVYKYLAWVQKRSDNKLHGGIISVLQYCAMLLRPNTGWLYLNPQVALKLDERARKSCLKFEPVGMDLEALTSEWQKICHERWSEYHERAKNLDVHKSKEKSREPKEPIQDILAHQRPLSVVIDMLATLKRNPPPCVQTKRYAVWTRDVLMLSWLAANPLRVSHFACMRWRRDNTGNVYVHEDGHWHYRCKRSDFKNSPKKFMNTPGGEYDVQLPPFVGEAIEVYLREGRPFLAGAYDGDYLFLPEKFANQTRTDAAGFEMPIMQDRWNSEAFSTRLRIVTRGLRDGKPGFGAHAFRHIVATDYLKRNPGAYQMVAHLLADSLETVLKEYGHTSAQDGLNSHYLSAEAELAAAMGGGVL